MAFPDPVTVTVNTVAKSLPRIFAVAGSPTTYKSADDEFKLEIAHSVIKSGRRERHMIKLTQRKIVADAFNPATNLESNASVHIVLENPAMGFTDTELGYIVDACAQFARGSSNLPRFIGGEA